MTNKKKQISKLDIAIRIIIVLIILAVAVLLTRLGFYAYERHQLREYPLKYEAIVEETAERYNVDKYLIYAIIKTESGFNPEVTSNMGARGLMQLMPDTFEWIRDLRLQEQELGLTFDDMYNPNDNIRYGVYLISYHLDHYKNIDNAIVAYHAGDGKVDAWLEDREYSKDGKTLIKSKIPIADSRHYLSKVKKAYNKYLELYEGEK